MIDLFKKRAFPKNSEFTTTNDTTGEYEFFKNCIEPLEKKFKEHKIDCYYQFKSKGLKETLDFCFFNQKNKKMLHLEVKKWRGHIILNFPKKHFIKDNLLEPFFYNWLREKFGHAKIENFGKFRNSIYKYSDNDLISVAVNYTDDSKIYLELRYLGVEKFNRTMYDLKNIFSEFPIQTHKILFLDCKTDLDNHINKDEKFLVFQGDKFIPTFCELNESNNYNIVNEMLEKYVY